MGVDDRHLRRRARLARSIDLDLVLDRQISANAGGSATVADRPTKRTCGAGGGDAGRGKAPGDGRACWWKGVQLVDDKRISGVAKNCAASG